jgi:Methyltransferase FkbM domain
LDSMSFAEPVGLLKVDVEGQEPAVLKGASGILRAWLPDVMVEAGDDEAFTKVAECLLDLEYVPIGRYAATPTYLFRAANQVARMRRVLARFGRPALTPAADPGLG